MSPRLRQALAVAAFTTLIGCMPAVRPDLAVLEVGWVHVDSIDRIKFPGAYTTFNLRPGAHTMDVTFTWSDHNLIFGGGIVGAAMAEYHTETRSLCVKARGGHRYRIKNVIRDKQMYVFIIDASTGEPPKTPCGPDEDDD
jgi:hypothetical protein